jgi:hypothetical protein
MIMDREGDLKTELQTPDLIKSDEWDEDTILSLTPILLNIHGDGASEVYRKEIGKMIGDKLIRLCGYGHDEVVKDLEVLKTMYANT